MSGRVEAIWTKRSKGGVMDAAQSVDALEGKGIEGDANFGATRQVSVIEKEVFDRIKDSLPTRPCAGRTSWSAASASRTHAAMC